MKKVCILFVFSIFSFVFTQSCNKNADASTMSAAVFWKYTGSQTLVTKAIADLQKKYPTGDFQNSVNGQPLWQKGVAVLANEESIPTLIVPVKSFDRDKIEKLLLIDYKSGALNHHLVSPKDIKTPLLSSAAWRGYIKALDKKLFGLQNGSSGFKTRRIKDTDAGRTNCAECLLACWIACEIDIDAEENCEDECVKLYGYNEFF